MDSERRALARLRERAPLVHCLSNLVSANDCANLLLSVGARPIMAVSPEEAEDVTRAASATVLSCGTPDEERFSACLAWGREAAGLGRPLILDPVGAGASGWRLSRILELLERVPVSILRVNLGEALALLRGEAPGYGVDAPSGGTPEEREELALALSERYRCAVLLSGEEDLAACSGGLRRAVGGSGMMASVTGTGCMLSALCGAFAAVEPDPAMACLLASRFWKECAELAERTAGGPGSFRAALLDAAWRIGRIGA